MSSQREQLNLASSFIDASQIYGNDKQTSNSLRLFLGGQLLSTNGIVAGKAYLPQLNTTCSASSTGTLKCFASGDPDRTGENLGLTGERESGFDIKKASRILFKLNFYEVLFYFYYYLSQECTHCSYVNITE